MPDVGVLNLQIQDNSESAARGLDNLAGALGRVRQAVGDGLKLASVASGLKRIANTVEKKYPILPLRGSEGWRTNWAN